MLSAAAFRDPAPADAGPRITDDGILLGPSPLAVRRQGTGTAVLYQAMNAEELAETLAVAYGWDILSDFDARLGYLQSAVKALNDGTLTQAHISLAFMNLPKLDDSAVDRLRQLEVIRKYNPNVETEPRDARGRWTSDGGGIQVAANDTVQSDASNGSTGTRDPHIVTLRDGSLVTDFKGNPMPKPPDVSLQDNARLGEEIYHEYEAMTRTAGFDAAERWRDGTITELMLGPMNYQLVYSTDGEHYNRDYIDLGNYNYGVVVAAAGYSWGYAITASGFVNLFGQGDKSGPYFNNPRNLEMIRKGFNDYLAGRIVANPKSAP
jgi:Bacterial toxin 44